MRNIFYVFFQVYTWLVIIPVSWLITAMVSFSVLIFSYLFSERWASKWIAPWWGRLIIWVTFCKVKRTGLQNIVKGQSYVVVCNHQSLYDIMTIYGYLPLEIKWVMKKELEKMPFVGMACKVLGHIFVDRSDSKKAKHSLINAKSKISDGVCVFFFPEGTRSTEVKLLPFKKGAFRMAKDLDLPILPMTISGANKVMAPHSLVICPHVIEMVIHAPIPINNVRRLSIQELSERSKLSIASKL